MNALEMKTKDNFFLWKQRLKSDIRYLDLQNEKDYGVFMLLVEYLRAREGDHIGRVRSGYGKSLHRLMNSEIKHGFFKVKGVDDRVISIRYGKFHGNMGGFKSEAKRAAYARINKRSKRVGIYHQPTGYRYCTLTQFFDKLPPECMELLIWDLDKIR